MLFELIANLDNSPKGSDQSRIHEVMISSEKSLEEVYAQVGLSVFSGREHLNSIFIGTTYFGEHCAGFFACLKDHLYVLDEQGLPSEAFEFHLISMPKEEGKKDFLDFVLTLILFKINLSEYHLDSIRILVHRDFIENLSRETDWDNTVDEWSIPIDPYAHYLENRCSEIEASNSTDVERD